MEIKILKPLLILVTFKGCSFYLDWIHYVSEESSPTKFTLSWILQRLNIHENFNCIWILIRCLLWQTKL